MVMATASGEVRVIVFDGGCGDEVREGACR